MNADNAMIENDMRQPIVKWLASEGMEDAHECLVSCCGYCDVIGFKFAPRVSRAIPPLLYSVAVELKMSNVSQVIMQARQNRRWVNASYAAMPMDRCNKMRKSTLDRFRKENTGLLAVNGWDVRVLIPSAWYMDGREQRLAKKWWRWHRRNEQNKRADGE